MANHIRLLYHSDELLDLNDLLKEQVPSIIQALVDGDTVYFRSFGIDGKMLEIKSEQVRAAYIYITKEGII